jgi:hypothetical protein
MIIPLSNIDSLRLVQEEVKINDSDPFDSSSNSRRPKKENPAR